VIRLAGRKKNWLNIHQSYVYTAQEYKGWSKWWEGLPDAKDLAKDGGPYIVILDFLVVLRGFYAAQLSC
jgi:hypothetical protein